MFINGREWTFRTAGPPPEARQIREDHPRLLITKDNIPSLRKKLSHPVYGNKAKYGSYWWRVYRAAEKGDTLANAFLYWMGPKPGWGQKYGLRAKALVLSGKYPKWGIGYGNDALTSVLSYDWTAPLLSQDEKRQVFASVKQLQGYDHTTKSGEPRAGWYNNNPWNGSKSKNPGFHIWYGLAGLVGYGDGVDDPWCRSVVDAAYGDNPWVMGPYGPKRGYGILDVLNTMALDSGGSQAGGDGTPGSGYTGMFLGGSSIFLAAWETATNEPVLTDCNFLKFLPMWWTYEFENQDVVFPSREMSEFLTGMYRQSAPDMAALMKHRLDTRQCYGRYQWVLRMILGDRRVRSKSPAQCNLPTAKYLRGADLFVSRTSWNSDASVVKVYCRYLDTNRYEQHSGTLSLKHRGASLLSGAKYSKTSVAYPQNHSGLWIWRESLSESHGSTFWGRLNNLDPNRLGRSRRAKSAYEVASEPVFASGNPLRLNTQPDMRLIEMDTTKLWHAAPVRLARRTVAHLIGDARQFLVIYDRTDVPSPLKRAWNLRLPTDPQINGARVKVVNRRAQLVATAFVLAKKVSGQFSACDSRWEWSGGEGKEWIGPQGAESRANYARRWPRSGYSADQVAADKYGRGNLFLRSDSAPQRLNYLVVCEFGDKGFQPVEIRLQDKTVRFGDWEATIGPTLEVSRTR